VHHRDATEFGQPAERYASCQTFTIKRARRCLNVLMPRS
jgi:hypothetical protein